MTEIARELRPREEIEPGATDSLGKIAGMIRPGAKVLDLGTARGALGRWASQHGCTVDGVEQDPGLAEVARAHYRYLHRADLETVDLAELVGGETYDIVVCADVLEHLRSPERTLLQIPPRLRPGGELLISVPNVAYIGVVLELLLGQFDYRTEGLLDRTHVQFFTRTSLVELLDRAGFAVQSIESVLVDLDRSEFARSAPERLDPVLLAALSHRPDGAVYQFIVRATPGRTSSSESLIPVDHPAVGFHSQIYWKRIDEAYDESRSHSVFLSRLDSRHKIGFPLPAGISDVRWDALDRPGIVSLHRLELVTSDGRLLWSSDGSDLVGRVAASGQVRWLTSVPPISFLALAGDPWLEIPLPDELAEQGETQFRIDFSVIASEEGTRIAEAVRRAEERTGGALGGFEKTLQSLERRTRALEENMAALGTAVQGIAAAVSGLAEQVERAGRAQEARLDQLAELGRENARQLEGRARGALRNTARRLLRRGLSRRTRLDPIPLTGVEAAIDGWHATSGDPQLELRPSTGSVPGGRVVARYELDVDVDEASLYVDVGQGFEEARRIRLPAGRMELTLDLPDRIRALRLDPRESPGPFRIGSFTLVGSIEPERLTEVLRRFAGLGRRP